MVARNTFAPPDGVWTILRLEEWVMRHTPPPSSLVQSGRR
jgi:hypothetical protein